MRSFIQFLSIFTLILGSAYTYTGIRLVEGLNITGNFLILFWTLVVLLVLLVPVSYFISQWTTKTKIRSVFSFLAFLGLGYFTILFSLVLANDFLLLLLPHLIPDLIVWLKPSLAKLGYVPPEESQYLPHLLSLSAVLTSILLTAYGFLQTHVRLRSLTVKVPIQNLHPDLFGFSIVQISDVHVGPTIQSRFIKKVVKRINRLQPDCVVITGDLVDGPASQFKEHIQPLREIQAKYGVFYVTGNHEYYSGVMPWLNELQNLGIQVLLNENRQLKINSANLCMAGVTDLKAGNLIKTHSTDPGAAIRGGEQADLKVLLAHQPNSALEAVKYGYHLQISGHTHGGQYFPGNLLIYLFQKFVAGLHHYKGMWIYVSRGTGYWGPPLRIGSPSEVTKLVLVNPGEETN
ncbi:calcineurin-like phosphoesterase family protein [Leptospira ryugenii]|uniref:Calcineurin-like phosphoesterase family protein n=1 Tax=Leptospira ryugenii TaxID=1917863 RepID=A0A2P2E0M6_9LEPT|nr:metallophosphoesterase [Leptospira ryugenii]GBF50431.1 calcineurin-like phosphoesterase family protein [Leptospira ryugenii]